MIHNTGWKWKKAAWRLTVNTVMKTVAATTTSHTAQAREVGRKVYLEIVDEGG